MFMKKKKNKQKIPCIPCLASNSDVVFDLIYEYNTIWPLHYCTLVHFSKNFSNFELCV